MKRKSETASINHKRGRPPAFSIGEDAAVKETWGGLVTTKRGLRNKQYAALGARAICPDAKLDPRHAWLATNEKARQSVLTELGRIARKHGDEMARMMADLVAEMVAAGAITTTREAETFLRETRLRKPIPETDSENQSHNGHAAAVEKVEP